MGGNYKFCLGSLSVTFSLVGSFYWNILTLKHFCLFSWRTPSRSTHLYLHGQVSNSVDMNTQGRFAGVEDVIQLLRDESSCPALPRDNDQMKHYPLRPWGL